MGVVIIDDEIVLSEHLSMADGALYVALRSFRNSKSGACYPAMPTLAKRARISINTAYRSRKKLQQLGVITWTEGRGRGQKCEYILLLVDGSEEDKRAARDSLMKPKISQMGETKDDKIYQTRETKDGKIYQTGETKDGKIPPISGKSEAPTFIKNQHEYKTINTGGSTPRGPQALSKTPLREYLFVQYRDEIKLALETTRLKYGFDRSKYGPVWDWYKRRKMSGTHPGTMVFALSQLNDKLIRDGVRGPIKYLDAISDAKDSKFWASEKSGVAEESQKDNSAPAGSIHGTAVVSSLVGVGVSDAVPDHKARLP